MGINFRYFFRRQNENSYKYEYLCATSAWKLFINDSSKYCNYSICTNVQVYTIHTLYQKWMFGLEDILYSNVRSIYILPKSIDSKPLHERILMTTFKNVFKTNCCLEIGTVSSGLHTMRIQFKYFSTAQLHSFFALYPRDFQTCRLWYYSGSSWVKSRSGRIKIECVLSSNI